MMSEVKALLKKYNICTKNWGQDATKSVADLEREVREGDSVLVESGEELVRKTTILHVDVYCAGRKLREGTQLFSNGYGRTRSLVASLAEKVKTGEWSDHAVNRALKEELGIPVEGIADAEFGESWSERKDSPSYPGLTACFRNHKAVVEIKKEWYRPEGYREDQSDKITFFVWD